MNNFRFRTFTYLLLPALACSAQQAAPTAAQIAQRQMQRYAALLSLTTEQQTEALAIFTAEATSEEPLESSSRTLHKTLDAAVLSDDVSVIKENAASLGSVEGELAALHTIAQAALYQLLTAEQKTRFTALQEAGVEGGGPGAAGPGGPPGPPR